MRYDFENDEKPPLLQRILKEAGILLLEIIVVILLAYGIIRFGVEKTEMMGPSMEPTLKAGDEIIINKMAYRFHEPARFDVVVFKQSGREHSYYNIKRIIGRPGETVQIKDGQIYIDGELIEEQVQVEPMNNPGVASEPVKLDENEYFVLGDNRNNSEDSRFANIGNIVSDEIEGKASLRLNGFNFISKLNLVSSTENEDGSQSNSTDSHTTSGKVTQGK